MSSGRATQPRSLRIRSYQVGFGDCFLLTFRYANGERHVLIDFGSTARPQGSASLEAIAPQIREDCDGKLHGVVATHRHRDHISGFATRPRGDGPGNIIASCQPNVVVQPWTEDPAIAPDARGPKTDRHLRMRAFTGTLAAMEDFAQSILHFTRTTSFASSSQKRRLQFLGENNISNRSAVENLMRMGKSGRAVYAHYGSKSGLEAELPGVSVHVLGPPTLEQSEAIRHQRSMSTSEYWHMRALGTSPKRPGAAASADAPFPGAATFQAFPTSARWLVDRLHRLQLDEVFEMVRILDDQMNNTSLILLFRIGTKGILFPGDAQYENWSYALSQRQAIQLLKNVHVYKVGHHGSLNGTPKSLWKLFANRAREGPRMISLNSTMPGIHGSVANKTEVPRQLLVDTLKQETNYLTTQSIKGVRGISFLDVMLDF